ncbi:27 kDa hemolymph protein-like [Xylocopa sonorina]|uniref:27 kDa hemolymph protein-like n=1 Tax=Xylocopa sonorina TaxID=1818115 RepID=UPI00403AD6A9
MTKYSVTFTAVVFVCAFLPQIKSQENFPNAEEIVHHLNLPEGTDINQINSSVINVVGEVQNVFKQKCEKNGGEKAFDNVVDAATKLDQCLKSFVNLTQLEKEMGKYKLTGDLDLLFKNYCRKTPTLKKCVSNFTAAIDPCLESEEKENGKIIRNITDSLLNFVCFKEGDRIALFIAAQGPECLESKQQEMQNCANRTIGHYIPQIDPNNATLPGLNNLPSLVLGASECADIMKLQTCVIKELEKCSDPTPANIVDSIFTFIRQVTPCKNFTTAENSASTSTVSYLVMISIVISLSRFVWN